MRGIPAFQRALSRLIKSDEPDACWNWPGAIGSDGYGHIRDGHHIRAVHRVVFEGVNGVILSDEEHVLHSCDNPLCARPSHLKLGDHDDNMSDMSKKKRNRVPRPGNGYTKVTREQYVEIANMAEELNNNSEVGRRFGITPTRVRQIRKFVNGKT